MERYRGLLLLSLCLAALLAGCGGKVQPVSAPSEEVSIREAVTEADPQAAIDEILEALPDAQVEALTETSFQEAFPNLYFFVDEYYGSISHPNGGLADVFIMKPREGSAYREQVRDSLRLYQQARILEFEDYDILDAFSIATDAEVYDQGDYVILLMLPDNVSGREIVDKYLPL